MGPSPSLASDRPIDRRGDDRLERSGLVQAIVATVERAPRTGFVVGLAGPWGEGKSSVLNMTAETLDERGLAHVVSFNPWMFTGADELLERFFSELSAKLDLGGPAGQRAAKALDSLGRALGRLGPAPLLGNAFEAGGAAAEGAARLLQAGTSLHDRRSEVAAALEKLDRPIVVVVDDLDRLRSNEEIGEMVRLIRLVGDLPRVTYLLAYEREVVARALGDGDVPRGEAYLEKIVQVPFELPPVRRDLLDVLLTEAMDAVVGDLDERRFNSDHFSSLQFAGFRELFRNVRDVRRFTSALPAILAELDDEVELADVLVLEALRTLEPSVFVLIAANTQALTSVRSDSLQAGHREEAEHAQAVKDILAVARRPGIVADLLKQLFPAAERHLGGMTYSSSFARTWRRQGRVASHEALTTYLERGLPSSQVSARQVQDALALLDDRDGMERLFAETKEAKLIRLLSRLEDFEGDFDLARPEMTIEVLSAAANRFLPRDRPTLRYDRHVAISRLLLRILRGRDPDKIEEIVGKVHWRNLSSRATVVGMVGHRSGGNRLVDERAADALEAALVEAILTRSSTQLCEEPEMARLIWIAEDREQQRTAERLSTFIGDPAFLVRWLRDELLEKRGRAGTTHLLPWIRLVERVDAAHLIAAVDALEDDWVTEHADHLAEEAIRQARLYVAHPEQAADDYGAFTGEEASSSDDHE